MVSAVKSNNLRCRQCSPRKSTSLAAVLFLCPLLLASVCTGPPGRSCPSSFGEVAPDSVWFNQKDVAAVAWDVRGDWLYSESTGRAKTRFRLTTAWTGEPYSGLRYDCPDGTHGVGEISVPTHVQLVTDDGAFNESLSAQASGPFDEQVQFLVTDLPASELKGTFAVPPHPEACSAAAFQFGSFLFFRSRIQFDNDPWVVWTCGDGSPEGFPVGSPIVTSVAH